MGRIFRTLSVLFFILAALPAMAQTQAETFMFTPAVGQMLFDSNRHVKDVPFYNISVGYQFDEIWVGEAMFGVFETKSKSTARRSTGYHFNLNGLYHFYPAEKLNPYLIAGVGLLAADKLDWSDGGALMQKSAATINAGVGLKYDLTPAWQIRAEAREFIVRHSIDHDFDTVINLGLTWYFNNPRRQKLRTMKPVQMDLQKVIRPFLILAEDQGD